MDLGIGYEHQGGEVKDDAQISVWLWMFAERS